MQVEDARIVKHYELNGNLIRRHVPTVKCDLCPPPGEKS